LTGLLAGKKKFIFSKKNFLFLKYFLFFGSQRGAGEEKVHSKSRKCPSKSAEVVKFVF